MKLPDISGKFTTPKPWQIATGIAVVVVFVFVAPAITHVLVGEKKRKETAQLTSIGKIGEAWHPASFAVPLQPPKPPPRLPTPLQVQATPQPRAPAQAGLAATKAPAGKATADPEQDAINAPILISGAGAGSAATPAAQATRTAGEQHLPGEAGGTASPMAGLLKPTELPGYSATVMRHPGTTIPQGTIIACNSVTRATSGLPGFIDAKIARDVWSADNTMLLIERDSKIFGEIQHGIVNGAERLFVLWHQITTPAPNFVRITLNSPAADEMGEAGLTGDIDTHFWKKVKGAILLSGIDMLFQGASGALSNLGHSNESNNQSQGLNLNFSQAGSQGTNLASQMLQSTIQIPDTLTVNQSAPCSIFVASDLSFDSVYSATKRNGH